MSRYGGWMNVILIVFLLFQFYYVYQLDLVMQREVGKLEGLEHLLQKLEPVKIESQVQDSVKLNQDSIKLNEKQKETKPHRKVKYQAGDGLFQDQESESLHHNYRIPVSPNMEYTYDDFEQYFKIKPLHTPIYDPDILRDLDKISAKSDPLYQSDPSYYDALAEKHAAYVDQGSHEDQDREKMFVKWSSPETGYGLFANRLIKKDEVVGLFTGFISSGGINTDYMWEYPSAHLTGENMYGIDALSMGNYLRFVNHDRQKQNVRIEMFPHRNRWWLLYVADKEILAGSELFTDYGDSYFTSRGYGVNVQ